MSSRLKDPNAVLDFGWDWNDPQTPWLTDGETITSYTVTVPAGITKNSDSQDNGKVAVWLSGGAVGQTYAITCRVTTNQGRTDDRTMRVTIRER